MNAGMLIIGLLSSFFSETFQENEGRNFRLFAAAATARGGITND